MVCDDRTSSISSSGIISSNCCSSSSNSSSTSGCSYDNDNNNLSPTLEQQRWYLGEIVFWWEFAVSVYKQFGRIGYCNRYFQDQSDSQVWIRSFWRWSSSVFSKVSWSFVAICINLPKFILVLVSMIKPILFLAYLVELNQVGILFMLTVDRSMWQKKSVGCYILKGSSLCKQLLLFRVPISSKMAATWGIG